MAQIKSTLRRANKLPLLDWVWGCETDNFLVANIFKFSARYSDDGCRTLDCDLNLSLCHIQQRIAINLGDSCSFFFALLAKYIKILLLP